MSRMIFVFIDIFDKEFIECIISYVELEVWIDDVEVYFFIVIFFLFYYVLLGMVYIVEFFGMDELCEGFEM